MAEVRGSTAFKQAGWIWSGWAPCMLGLALCLLPLAAWSQEAVYQGRLTDGIGNPLTGSVASLELRIYNDQTAGASLYEELHLEVPLSDEGVFSVPLGGGIPQFLTYDASLFTGTIPRYLEVRVNNELLSPRQRIGTVPTALVAEEWSGEAGLQSQVTDAQSTAEANAAGISTNAGAISGFATGPHTQDTNTQLSNAEVGAAALAQGFVAGAHTTNTNTQLDEAAVDAFVANNGFGLATAVDGNNGLIGDLDARVAAVEATDDAASVVADSAVTSGAENNAIMNPQWNYINPDTVAATINAPCEISKPCIIGQSATYPQTRVDIFDDWETPGSAGSISRGNDDFSGFDTYPGAASGASYSSINGADDTIINSQLGTTLGCRHCLIGPLNTASGHNYVGPGGLSGILGEVEYGLVLGGNTNFIIGPGTGFKTSSNVIAGGQFNKIDFAGITGGDPNFNTIGGGTNNTIGHTGVRGVFGSVIAGGKTNTIINSSTNSDITSATITGGQQNEIKGIVGEVPANGATVSGTRGSAWMPNQNVYGAGVGYNATDDSTGALQTFDLMWRQDIAGGIAAAQGLFPSNSGSIPKLQYAGVYTLSGQLSCQSQTDITLNLPTKLEVWPFDGVMMWTGGAAEPQFVSSTDDTPDNNHNLISTMTVGGANTWEGAVRGAVNGGWYVSVASGSDLDAMYCQGDMRVIQSRQDTTGL